MADLPQVDPVYRALELDQVPNLCRPHLGMSGLNNDCKRYLWYSFRWAYLEYITPRQQRIFNRGDLEEHRIIKDLTAAGMVVTNTQLELVGFAGHCLGHIDGMVDNVPGAEKTTHLLEMKTAKAKKHLEFTRFGVEKSNPVYYGQAQSYMKHTGLTRTLFICTNKDDESRYYERLHYDEKLADELDCVAMDIVSTDVPPPKLSEQTEYYICRWCAAQDVCHKGEPMLRGCRTCNHVELHDNGEFKCGLAPNGGPIPVDFQRVGCKAYDRMDAR